MKSQSAFAGYGLEVIHKDNTINKKYRRNPLSLDMGWKLVYFKSNNSEHEVAIRFRWIWVGREWYKATITYDDSRNPLSLDMGWKKLF